MKSTSNQYPLVLTGAGGGDAPSTAQDNLLSEDFFEIVLALGEGEIQGIVKPTTGAGPEAMWALSNVMAGDTPVYNLAAGEMNFTDFSVDARYGATTDPAFTPKLGGEASNLAVNTSLGYNVSVVRRTPATARGITDCLEVRLLISQLFVSSGGSLSDGTGQFRISYKRASSGVYVDYQGETVTSVKGKTSAGYVKEFSIPVPRVSEDYDVRVIKLTPDAIPGAEGLTCQASWESLQMVKYGVIQHSRLAMLHLYGKATNQFSSIPEFSAVVDGLLLAIPSNYNPVARTYNESVPWNLIMKIGHTNNNAWVLYNLIVNPDWGLARYYKGVSANRADFYTEAKWCDELVPDGAGGYRPRFTFNMNMTEMKPGLELIRYVAGSFNAVIMDDGNGVISIRTDRPRTGGQIFTPENVKAGEFQYSFTDISTRYNDVGVKFINPDLNWEEDYRKASVNMGAFVTKNGRIEYEFEAVGCTNAHEAVCRANYRAITANREKTTVSFVTSRFGLICRLLDQILIADPLSGWSTGGRVKSVAGNVIQLRDPIFVQNASARTMRVQTNTGLTNITVTPPATGLVYTLTITGGTWPTDVPERTVFTLEDTTSLGIAKPFRVVGLEEVDGSPDVIQVSALEVYENKYTDAETGVLSEPVQYSYTTPGGALLPISVTFTTPAPIVAPDGSLLYSIEAEIKRQPSANTNKFEFHFRRLGDSAWSVRDTYSNSILLNPVVAGKIYEIRVYSVSPIGVRSRDYLSLNYTVATDTVLPPEKVTGLVATLDNSQGVIKWDKALAADYKYTEVRIGDAASTVATAPIYGTIAGTRLPWVPWPAAGTYNIFVRHFNWSEKPSAIAEAIIATVTTTTITSTVSGTNLLSNSRFLKLVSDATSGIAPYQPSGWGGYAVNYTLAGYWAFEDRVGRDGQNRSIALRTVAAAPAGTAAGRAGFVTGLSIQDLTTTGGVAGGWKPGRPYTVSFWARMWSHAPVSGGTEGNIAYVAAASGNGTSQTTITATKPAGLAVGHLMIFATTYDEYLGPTVSRAGWTLQGGMTGSGAGSVNGRVTAVLWKIADAADVAAASFAFTINSSWAGTFGWVIAAYSGVSTSSPIAAATPWATTTVGGTTPPTTPALATTGNTSLVWIGATDPVTDAGGTLLGPTTAFINRAQGASSTGNGAVSISDKVVKAANGTVTAKAGVVTGGTTWGYDAMLIALRPATTGGGAGVSQGLYLNGTSVHGGDRSYMMARISRATGLMTFSRTYDVYGVGAGGTGAGNTAATLAADLNATGSDSIVVVWTADNPLDHRTDNGLATALYRCGASPGIFVSDQWQPRCAYQLIGVAGSGEGRGYERYKGAVNSDPTAVIDTRFSVVGGLPVISSTGAYRVVSVGFGLTAALTPAQVASPWEGIQSNLYWNQAPATFAKVQCPGISYLWQQYKFSFENGVVTEPGGNLYWGIGDETGATVLPAIPIDKVGTVLELSEPMVCEGTLFPAYEQSPQDELLEGMVSTATLAQNAVNDTVTLYDATGVTYNPAV
jgi:predicted phage tail protein